MKERFPDAVAAESYFLVLPFDVTDFESHEALTQTVLQHFQKVSLTNVTFYIDLF